MTACLATQSSFIFFLLGLFSALDSHSNLDVISYGVSMTTLEDVFLKLEVEAEIDQAGKNKSNRTFQAVNETGSDPDSDCVSMWNVYLGKERVGVSR